LGFALSFSRFNRRMGLMTVLDFVPPGAGLSEILPPGHFVLLPEFSRAGAILP